MAGVAGEVNEFGSVSSAIGDDLHAATKLARSMITSFGMSERLGRVTVGEPGAVVVLRVNWAAVRETAETLNHQETLSGVALAATLSTVQPMPIESLDIAEDPRPPERVRKIAPDG